MIDGFRLVREQTQGDVGPNSVINRDRAAGKKGLRNSLVERQWAGGNVPEVNEASLFRLWNAHSVSTYRALKTCQWRRYKWSGQ